FVFRFFLALPPNLQVRSCDYLVWREVGVLARMPLCGNLRKNCGERVGDRNLFPSTVWAPSRILLRSRNRGSTPLMVRAGLALPPEVFIGARHHLVWRNIAVLCRMPLCGYLGEHRCKGVCD